MENNMNWYKKSYVDEESLRMNGFLQRFVLPKLQRVSPDIDEYMLLNIMRMRTGMDKRRPDWVQGRGEEHYKMARDAMNSYGTDDFPDKLDALIRKLTSWYLTDAPKGIVKREHLKKINYDMIRNVVPELAESTVRDLASKITEKDTAIARVMKLGFQNTYGILYHMQDPLPLQEWYKDFRWFYKESGKITEMYKKIGLISGKQHVQPKMTMDGFREALLSFAPMYDSELRDAYDSQNFPRIFDIVVGKKAPVPTPQPQVQPSVPQKTETAVPAAAEMVQIFLFSIVLCRFFRYNTYRASKRIHSTMASAPDSKSGNTGSNPVGCSSDG